MDVVECEGLVEPPPEILVIDGDHAAVVFPAPGVPPPGLEPEPNPSGDIAARGDEGDAGGLIEGLQSANDGQQFQAFRVDMGLLILDVHAEIPVGRLEDEAPPPLARALAGRAGSRVT